MHTRFIEKIYLPSPSQEVLAMRKVLFVVDARITFSEAPPSRLLYIAKALKNRGFKVEIVGRKGEEVEDLRITPVDGKVKHTARLKTVLHAYIKAIFRSYYYIFVRGSLLAFPLLLLRILNKEVILDFHGWLFEEISLFYEKSFYNKLKAIFYSFLEIAVVKCSNVIVCCSEGGRNLLRENEKRKSILLENGLDVKEAERAIEEAGKERRRLCQKYSIEKDKPLIGFMGNWERQLDMETMFLGAQIAKVRIIVIGEGPNLEKCKKKWKNVIFTGRLPRFEGLKIISLCKAAVVPYKETSTTVAYYSSRKVKDYLGLKKPILMSKVTGREKFLVPNKNVILYEPGNAEDLAKKIKILFYDKNLQENMKVNNGALARHFDWETLVEKSSLPKILLK